MKSRIGSWVGILGFVLITQVGLADITGAVPAFPGAEGSGVNASGGRGGVVYLVTNLNDSGPGSLRAALEASGPRTVVFRTSGTISLLNPLTIRNSKITIAGQTAPGDGICLKDAGLGISADDVIIRFIRARLGNDSLRDSDSISVSKGKRIILDHCSASWSTDEALSASTNQDRLDEVTVQWSFITEALNNAIPGKGSHGYGSLIRGNRGATYSFHHNLYAHQRGRSPRPGNYDNWNHQVDPEGFLLDFRNNAIYNFGGGYAGYNGDHESITKINYIQNYLIRGINSDSSSVAYKEQSIYNKGYFFKNSMNGIIPADPYALVRFPPEYTPEIIAAYKRNAPFSVRSVQTDSPQIAYERVLKEAGAIYPARDAVDSRVVDTVLNRTGRVIDDEDEVGGWPLLEADTPPIDSDEDGMPDDWESARGLNPSDPSDRNGDRNRDEYTNLEEYLNWLIRPSVSFRVSEGSVAEGNIFEITAERSGYVTSSLRANIEIGGNAINGQDFQNLYGYMVFPVGRTTTVIRISTLKDKRIENPEQITVRILSHPDQYRLGEIDQASIELVDRTDPSEVESGVGATDRNYH